MNTTQVEPLRFTDEHYIALGRMVVEFQFLEQVITQSLVQLMHPSDLQMALGFTHTVVNELSFSARRKLLSNFVESKPVTHFIPTGTKYEKIKSEEMPELLKRLRLGLKLASEAEEERNAFTHSQWLTDPICGPPGTVLRMKFRAGPKRICGGIKYVKPADILALVLKMDEAARSISKETQHLLAFMRSQEPA